MTLKDLICHLYNEDHGYLTIPEYYAGSMWDEDEKTSVSITLNEHTVKELQEGFPAAIDLAEAVRMAVEAGLEERRRQRLHPDTDELE